VDYAKKHAGMLIRKMNGLGVMGWPDRMFMYNGNVMFIEFKRPGGKVTEVQQKMHERIMSAGFRVWVVDDKQVGKSLIDKLVEGDSCVFHGSHTSSKRLQ
jgi:predicted methyltransferase MtxX (methanogen marker protein 4)